MSLTTDSLFRWFEKLHGPTWGNVLDAGTGDHSLSWLAARQPAALTAVTAERWRMESLQAIAPHARILLGQWSDPTLLYGETFDTVLVDYVIGALDGHAPYFQYQYLRRLRPHVGGRLYFVGMEPPPRDNSELDEICRVRDACILLAGHRCYREYPQELVVRWLEDAGYRILDSKVFPNKLGPRYINGQLDVAVRKLKWFRDAAVAQAMEAHIAELRERALAGGERVWGADYVIAAEAV